MRLKMLVSVAGPGFALSVGDETDRFSDKDAKRLIEAGHAEKAPVVEPKRPATKAEWDDERRKLLAENATLTQQLEASLAREAAQAAQLAGLTVLKATLATALETATQAPAPETRG